MSEAADTAFDFAGVYRRHAADVFRYALFLCGDRTRAEDIVSETFVRVWGARERVELTTVRAYLLAIARNVFLKGGSASITPGNFPVTGDPATSTFTTADFTDSTSGARLGSVWSLVCASAADPKRTRMGTKVRGVFFFMVVVSRVIRVGQRSTS